MGASSLGGDRRTLRSTEGRQGPHPVWTALPHTLLPPPSDRKGQGLPMALFLRWGQRHFLAQRNSQPAPAAPCRSRTHRSVGATRKSGGSGTGDRAKGSGRLAEALLPGVRGSGSASPGVRPARPECPGKESSMSGTQPPPVNHHLPEALPSGLTGAAPHHVLPQHLNPALAVL